MTPLDEATQPGDASSVSPGALQGATSHIDIRQRTGTGVSIGSTCGAANEVTSTCGGGEAADISHYWIAPYDGVFRFSTHGGATLFDTVLQLTDWKTGSQLGCNDDAGNLRTSEVTLNAAAGQEIRVTVDGANQACGRFQLDILGTRSTCGACNTPPSSCHESNGLCQGATCVYRLKPAGAGCDDGDSCTLQDQCSGNGSCQGTPMSCDSPSQCQEPVGTCIHGSCHYEPSGPGTPCDDENACTLGESCNGQGACVFQDYLHCEGTAGYCQYADCDPTLGCIARPCEACAAGYCV